MDGAREWTSTDAAAHLVKPTEDSDKYSRGVVGLRTGSLRYPGAAVLSVEGAWRAGAGMVRFIDPASEEPQSARREAERAATEIGALGGRVLAARPETVVAHGRVQAWVVGAGTDAEDRTHAETVALNTVLAGAVPVVVDAGALDRAVGAKAPLIVTPHAREFARLRALLRERGTALRDDDDGVSSKSIVADTARALGGVVLLKGARTLIASPVHDGAVLSVRAGTPWLATAGAGDVLAGIIGALVAQHSARAASDLSFLAALAATGAWVHGAAARLAAGQFIPTHPDAPASAGGPGRPIVAGDVALAVPGVIGALLAR